MTRDEARKLIDHYLTDIFEIEPESITSDAKLQEDLNLDSIDAVDMMVQLQESTGKKVTPEQFEKVVVVDDLVSLVQELHD